MRLFLQVVRMLATVSILIARFGLETTANAQTEDSATAQVNQQLLQGERQPTAVDSAMYKELDLLRRDRFSTALQTSISVRVLEKTGAFPQGLNPSDFTVVVNGTPRAVKLQSPGDTTTTVAPLVLLVFPPNQSIVHSIGIHQAVKYFSAQPNEVLPWKVGLFDANGKMTPFTNGRSQLLVNLDVIDHATEPLQYTTSAGLPGRFRWEGTWLTKAEEAIGLMQRSEGPKVILAFNTIVDNLYGQNDSFFRNGPLASDGPAALQGFAQHIGAHIYIANVGGPEVLVPGGDASTSYDRRPVNFVNRGIGAPGLPSYLIQGGQQLRALNYFAYRTSAMMTTAKETMGAFSNSFGDLAGFIHRDLDQNYSLTFEMTAKDRDIGTPAVEVRLTDHTRKLAILDMVPVGSLFVAKDKTITKEALERVRLASRQPVSSPDFRIVQRVDYFPVRDGLEPVLPMSALVEWTGSEGSPRRLSVMESVEDTNLSSYVLDREVQANWNGRHLSWERDGHLHPGRYVWRISIHDDEGKVFSSVQQKITIDYPRGAAVAASSLVVGKECRSDDTATGGLKVRETAKAYDEELHFQIDPMRAAGCRLKPESTNRFAETDLLHAFVRIYPSQKWRKNGPEKWTAKFVLRSAAGAIETEQEIAFMADAGSGYLAYVELPLDAEAVRPGAHTLDVAMSGPGIRGDLKESRAIEIAAVGR